MRSTREPAQIARAGRCRRPMEKFRGVAFHYAIGIVDTKLSLVDEQPVRCRIVFEKSHRPFDPPHSSNERAGKQSDDAEVSDEKGNMMFSPGPARDSGHGKVRRQQ